MINRYLFAAILALIISSLSQVLLKKSSGEKKKNIIFEYLNIKVITAYGITFLSMILIVYSFIGISYKYGAIIESMGYLLVMIFSCIFLREKITLRKVLGNTVIIAGVIVFCLNL